MPDFSDYVVFADESGDHGLASIDPQFPVFALVFCMFEKERYINEVEPAFRRLKYKYFGHDAVVLHEREIRKQKAEFGILTNPDVRQSFLEDIASLMSAMPF